MSRANQRFWMLMPNRRGPLPMYQVIVARLPVTERSGLRGKSNGPLRQRGATQVWIL